MRATITKIDPLRSGTDGVGYHQVFFKTEWQTSAKTHLCPTHNNWRRWKDFLEKGVVLDNLELMPDGKTINADSYPRLVSRPAKQDELF